MPLIEQTLAKPELPLTPLGTHGLPRGWTCACEPKLHAPLPGPRHKGSATNPWRFGGLAPQPPRTPSPFPLFPMVSTLPREEAAEAQHPEVPAAWCATSPAIPISSNSEHCNRDMARVGNGVKENQTQERSAVTKTCTRARGGAVCARGGAGELRKILARARVNGTVPSCRRRDTFGAAEQIDPVARAALIA